jgi:hypothetical protein
MRSSIIQAAIAVTALTMIGAALPAAVEPNKLPPAFLGDWCRIGGTGKVIGRPAPWTYQRGRCPNPHYRLIVRSNGVTDRGQLCRLVDTFEGSKTVLARFNCGCKDGQTCTVTYWLSLTPGGRLQKLVAQR